MTVQMCGSRTLVKALRMAYHGAVHAPQLFAEKWTCHVNNARVVIIRQFLVNLRNALK